MESHIFINVITFSKQDKKNKQYKYLKYKIDCIYIYIYCIDCVSMYIKLVVIFKKERNQS